MLYEIRGTVRIIEDSWSNPQMFVVINGDKKDFNGNNIFFEYVQNQMANGQPSLSNPLYSASILPPDVEFPVNNYLYDLMRIIGIEQKKAKLIIGPPTSGIPTSGASTSGSPTSGSPTSEVSMSEVSTSEVSTSEVSTSEVSTSEVSTSEVSTSEVSTSEVSTSGAPTSGASTSGASSGKVSFYEVVRVELL